MGWEGIHLGFYKVNLNIHYEDRKLEWFIKCLQRAQSFL